MQIIQFDKDGYEPFFDYIKAYAIVCVLLGHTISSIDDMVSGLWVSMQVPLFVLLQSFHSLKKTKVTFDFSKLFWRIIAPFILVQAALFIILGVVGGFDYQLIIGGVLKGGYGPGSYFPWVYLQLAIVLKIVHPILRKGSMVSQAFVAVLVCEVLEIICSVTDMPEWLYRLLAFRYLFLVFLAWIWVTKGVKMTRMTVALSILSALAIIYFEYFAGNGEPFFFNTECGYHRWPCFVYVSYLMTYLLYQLYLWMRKSSVVDRWVRMLSKCSYEIFLVQMAACICVPPIFNVTNMEVNFGLRVALIFFVSIVGGYLFNVMYGKLIGRIR